MYLANFSAGVFILLFYYKFVGAIYEYWISVKYVINIILSL